MREAGITNKVYKNTMMNFAFKGRSSSLAPVLEGPSAIAISGMTLRHPQDNRQIHEGRSRPLEIKAGVVEGTFYDASGMQAVATIRRDELLSKLPEV